MPRCGGGRGARGPQEARPARRRRGRPDVRREGRLPARQRAGDAGLDDEDADHRGGAAGVRAGAPVHHLGGGDAQSPRIVLVGGGDPLLARAPSADGGYPARADLDTRARATARSLKAIGRGRVRLGYDTSLFSGPSVNPHWEPSYIPDGVISPVTPLWVDEGRVAPGKPDRSDDPAAAAARVFAAAGPACITGRGGRPDGRPHRGRWRPDRCGAEAPLAQIVQHILEVSDNEGAEVLAAPGCGRAWPAGFLRRGRPGRPGHAARTRCRHPRRRDPRRQRAVPPGPAGPGDPAVGDPHGVGRPAPAACAAPWRTCRWRGSPARSPRASGAARRRVAAGCAPRPAR